MEPVTILIIITIVCVFLLMIFGIRSISKFNSPPTRVVEESTKPKINGGTPCAASCNKLVAVEAYTIIIPYYDQTIQNIRHIVLFKIGVVSLDHKFDPHDSINITNYALSSIDELKYHKKLIKNGTICNHRTFFYYIPYYDGWDPKDYFESNNTLNALLEYYLHIYMFLKLQECKFQEHEMINAQINRSGLCGDSYINSIIYNQTCDSDSYIINLSRHYADNEEIFYMICDNDQQEKELVKLYNTLLDEALHIAANIPLAFLPVDRNVPSLYFPHTKLDCAIPISFIEKGKSRSDKYNTPVDYAEKVANLFVKLGNPYEIVLFQSIHNIVVSPTKSFLLVTDSSTDPVPICSYTYYYVFPNVQYTANPDPIIEHQNLEKAIQNHAVQFIKNIMTECCENKRYSVLDEPSEENYTKQISDLVTKYFTEFLDNTYGDDYNAKISHKRELYETLKYNHHIVITNPETGGLGCIFYPVRDIILKTNLQNDNELKSINNEQLMINIIYDLIYESLMNTIKLDLNINE